MSKAARTKQKRRDRRKAKASKWRRQGKVKMGPVVGHGQTGGSVRARSPDALSKDSLEAVFRRNGVELSPVTIELRESRGAKVRTPILIE